MVKEIFLSIQGEGVRAGTAAVFVRFAGCNLTCNEAEHGFDCDTDFKGGEPFSLGLLVDAIRGMGGPGWIIFTGGEPALQLDQPLVDVLHALGWKLAIETNGTKPLPKNLDWVCCSPKPGAKVVLRSADEVKCVVGTGQDPDPRCVSGEYWLVSPAFKGDELDPDAVDWCVRWVKEHPRWRLSLQTHKWIGVR